MDGKTYEELLQDVAWEMGKRFGEKGEAIYCSFISPPDGYDSVINVRDETGITIGEIDEFYLSLMKDANEYHRAATQRLEKAVQIMRKMWRVNHGK